MSSGESIVLEHREAWLRATTHDFLVGVRDRTLPERAFRTWLSQDRLFVEDLLWFQARLLARAPRPAQRVLAQGVLALVEELAWFERQSSQLEAELDTERLPATEHYRTLIERLDAEPFADAIAALWVLERVYLDAWSFAAPSGPPYDAFVEHWTTPEFRAYVEELEALVEPRHAGLAAAVLEAEICFWAAAFA
jgi:formylaminopyrimidine deformylase / aminopyrimidine aminohydrolase